MRARFLTRGQPVKVDGRVMIFLMRHKDGPACVRNCFQCEDFRGMNGPKDIGLTTMSDHYFAKHATPTTVLELRAVMKRVPALLEEIVNNNGSQRSASPTKEVVCAKS